MIYPPYPRSLSDRWTQPLDAFTDLTTLTFTFSGNITYPGTSEYPYGSNSTWNVTVTFTRLFLRDLPVDSDFLNFIKHGMAGAITVPGPMHFILFTTEAQPCRWTLLFSPLSADDLSALNPMGTASVGMDLATTFNMNVSSLNLGSASGTMDTPARAFTVANPPTFPGTTPTTPDFTPLPDGVIYADQPGTVVPLGATAAATAVVAMAVPGASPTPDNPQGTNCEQTLIIEGGSYPVNGLITLVSDVWAGGSSGGFQVQAGALGEPVTGAPLVAIAGPGSPSYVTLPGNLDINGNIIGATGVGVQAQVTGPPPNAVVVVTAEPPNGLRFGFINALGAQPIDLMTATVSDPGSGNPNLLAADPAAFPTNGGSIIGSIIGGGTAPTAPYQGVGAGQNFFTTVQLSLPTTASGKKFVQDWTLTETLNVYDPAHPATVIGTTTASIAGS